jgi:hypothetical protein
MNQLSEILSLAKKNKWCTQPFCTTCGSMEFRNEIKRFNRNELIEQLKGLSDMDTFTSRDAVILCFYKATMLGDVKDLLEPLNNSPAGNLLKSIFAHKEEKQRIREKNKQEEIDRHQAKVEATRLKASQDIGNAIRRKDFSAIDVLIAKGADLMQRDENGVTLQQKLDLIKTHKPPQE